MPPIVFGGRTGTDDPRERFGQAIELQPIVDPSGNLNLLAAQENMNRLRDVIDQRVGGVTGSIDALARLVGGQLLTATVGASTVADRSGDTVIQHQLQRVPSCLVWQQIVLPNNDGSVLPANYPAITALLVGSPRGGWGVKGGNALPWSKDLVYLRASVAATFRFILT